MKLSIAQMILERCEFSHQENFLSIPASTPIALSTVTLGVQVARDENDASKCLVRLVASSPEGASYRFSVTYTTLLNVQLDEGETVPDLDRQLMVTGCTMMFPYVRQVVASFTSQGRFGPTWIAPTDFMRLLSEAVPQVLAK